MSNFGRIFVEAALRFASRQAGIDPALLYGVRCEAWLVKCNHLS